MQKRTRCTLCGKYDDLPFDDACKCTEKEKTKHHDEMMKQLDECSIFGRKDPSISECKRILQANGYIVKKNPKRKKPHRKLVQFKDY